MKKLLDYLKLGYDFVKSNLVLVLIGLIVFFFIMWRMESNSATKNKDKYETEVKLKEALLDTVHIYKNKEDEWVSEKKTLQTTIKYLDQNIGVLSSSQKELLVRIKNIEKSNTIIAAALIKTNVVVDSINNIVGGIVDSSKNTVTFRDSIPNLQFDFTMHMVKPVSANIKPLLSINKIILPNTQFVDFYWKNDKKEGYPISFSVTNSNKYFKTYDINSYAIPELDKPIIKPNGWQKTGAWFKKNGQKITYVGVGVAAAIVVLKFL